MPYHYAKLVQFSAICDRWTHLLSQQILSENRIIVQNLNNMPENLVTKAL